MRLLSIVSAAACLGSLGCAGGPGAKVEGGPAAPAAKAAAPATSPVAPPAKAPGARPTEAAAPELPAMWDFPFELSAGKIFVQVMVNGKGPYEFAMDTGSPPTAIDINLARELGLNVMSGGRVGGQARYWQDPSPGNYLAKGENHGTDARAGCGARHWSDGPRDGRQCFACWHPDGRLEPHGGGDPGPG